MPHTLAWVGLLAIMAMVTSGCSQLPDAGTAQQSGDIRLDVRTDKNRYRVGDPVQITVRSSQASWVRVVQQDARGRQQLLWPNLYSPDRQLRPGETLTLPAPGENWALRAKPPHGREIITVVASGSRFPSDWQPGDAGPVGLDWGGPGAAPRGLTIEGPDVSQGQARWVYEVVP